MSTILQIKIKRDGILEGRKRELLVVIVFTISYIRVNLYDNRKLKIWDPGVRKVDFSRLGCKLIEVGGAYRLIIDSI